MQTNGNMKSYRVINVDAKYYIHTCVILDTLDRILYLETMRNVTGVFTERALGFSLYRRVTFIMLFVGTVIMHLIASLLTKPIRLLTKATKQMAGGDYAYRAQKVSHDELGQLTTDFNEMANALEKNIAMLEEELEAREEFMGAFAHELKTPLTAIIGYADMPRSHKLDEEKVLCRQTISIQRESVWRQCPCGFWILLLPRGVRQSRGSIRRKRYLHT